MTEASAKPPPAPWGGRRVPLDGPVLGSRPRDAARRAAVLAGSDALAIAASGCLAFLLWADPVRGQAASTYAPFLAAAPMFVLGYWLAGLYPGFGLGPVEILRRYWVVTITGYVGVAALTFALKLPDIYSRMTLGLAFLLSLVLVPTLRRITSRIVRRSCDWWPIPAVLVGDGRRTEHARWLTQEHPSREFRSVGVLSDERTIGSGAGPVLGPLDYASHVAEAGVCVAFADVAGPDAAEKLDQLRLTFPRVVILRDLAELPVDGVQLRNLGGVLGLEYGNNLLRPQARWLKRSVDVAGSGVALLAMLPLIVLAMLLVKLSSRGPALFWQSRGGKGERVIRVPKIRTMVTDADEQIEALLEKEPAGRAEWEAGFKLTNDPRVIPVVGRLLRRFSIDELPQLWSVLKGDMSLVGPRPFPEYHLGALSVHARRLRAEVRPGITGLWQIEARGEPDVRVQEDYDAFYIRNWSGWLDLYILAHTVSAVLTGRGAH